MPFFIPDSLLRLEYFGSTNTKNDEMAELYADERDFAFFCTHFHYSRADYNALTPTEKAFILKSYEDKVVSETTLIRDAVLNAVSNALRKKGSRFRSLWKKKCKKANLEAVGNDIEILKRADAKSQINWVEKIYKRRKK